MTQKIATGKKIRREVFKGITTRLMHLFPGFFLFDLFPTVQCMVITFSLQDVVVHCSPLFSRPEVDLELYFSPGTKKNCSLNSIICPVTWLILLPTEFLSWSNNPPPAVNCNGEQQPVLLSCPPSNTYWVSGGRETCTSSGFDFLRILWIFVPLPCHPTPTPLLFA